MDQLMTEKESYAERRELFRNIWATAMKIDGKDADIINKPKVIKTLRLDEVDRCIIGKKKKQRIKNLRTVCNKILDFCDRQDADDTFYEQMAAKETLQYKNIHESTKKVKHLRVRKKIKKAKSMLSSLKNSTQPRVIASVKHDVLFTTIPTKTSSKTSIMKIKSTTVMNSELIPKVEKAKQCTKFLRISTIKQILDDRNEIATSRKTGKKKLSIRKKTK